MAGESKIGDTQVTIPVLEDVGGLNVAMDDA